MAYKLAYIEDLNPGSIISDLQSVGFEVVHLNPETFEKTISEIDGNNFDAILLDFRLTQGEGKAKFDAPTIAQTCRTQSSNTGNHIPLFLISSERIISDFYEDFTSNDLFDLSIVKEVLQKNLEKYAVRLQDFINAYKCIKDANYSISEILNNSKKEHFLDYRFLDKINNSHHKDNTYKISRLIFNTLIRSIGSLIGEDVLAARLGVKMGGEGWEKLKDAFSDAKYTGIYSASYNRWWAREIEVIAEEKFKIPSLRRLKSANRVDVFKSVGFENIEALEKIKFAESTNFWTICKEKIFAIDPIDGLELVAKETIPWADTEYISLLAALESSPMLSNVKPSELLRFTEFQKMIAK